MTRSGIVKGDHPERGPLVAAYDEAAHHVEGKVCERRLGALLAPFTSEDEAKAAVVAAGAVLQ